LCLERETIRERDRERLYLKKNVGASTTYKRKVKKYSAKETFNKR